MVLNGLKGGKKTLWLKQHRSTVVDFYQQFGAEKTKEAFNLEEETLRKVLSEDTAYRIAQPFTKADRAIAQAEIAEAGVAELRLEVRRLKEQFEQFQAAVGQQLVTKFFLPLIQNGLNVKLEDQPQNQNPLGLEDFHPQQATSQVTASPKKSDTSRKEGQDDTDRQPGEAQTQPHPENERVETAAAVASEL